jgi:hypothetical protein
MGCRPFVAPKTPLRDADAHDRRGGLLPPCTSAAGADHSESGSAAHVKGAPPTRGG